MRGERRRKEDERWAAVSTTRESESGRERERGREGERERERGRKEGGKGSRRHVSLGRR